MPRQGEEFLNTLKDFLSLRGFSEPIENLSLLQECLELTNLVLDQVFI